MKKIIVLSALFIFSLAFSKNIEASTFNSIKAVNNHGCEDGGSCGGDTGGDTGGDDGCGDDGSCPTPEARGDEDGSCDGDGCGGEGDGDGGHCPPK